MKTSAPLQNSGNDYVERESNDDSLLLAVSTVSTFSSIKTI